MPAVVRGGRRQNSGSKTAPKKTASAGRRKTAAGKGRAGKLRALSAFGLSERWTAGAVLALLLFGVGLVLFTGGRAKALAGAASRAMDGRLAALGFKLERVHLQGVSAEALPAVKAALNLREGRAAGAHGPRGRAPAGRAGGLDQARAGAASAARHPGRLGRGARAAGGVAARRPCGGDRPRRPADPGSGSGPFRRPAAGGGRGGGRRRRQDPAAAAPASAPGGADRGAGAGGRPPLGPAAEGRQPHPAARGRRGGGDAAVRPAGPEGAGAGPGLQADRPARPGDGRGQAQRPGAVAGAPGAGG